MGAVHNFLFDNAVSSTPNVAGLCLDWKQLEISFQEKKEKTLLKENKGLRGDQGKEGDNGEIKKENATKRTKNSVAVFLGRFDLDVWISRFIGILIINIST